MIGAERSAVVSGCLHSARVHAKFTVVSPRHEISALASCVSVML
jgi:hypothetical protein